MQIGMAGAWRIGSSQAFIPVVPDGFRGTTIPTSPSDCVVLLIEIAGAR